MPNLPLNCPLALYIHIPWCVRKCPYCDFNSHAQHGELPEADYVKALLSELQNQQNLLADREIVSLFFGGGTPSLFSAKSIAAIIEGANHYCRLAPNVEISLEANPGTVDVANFQGFKSAGVNRLSIGVQSLQDAKLRALGRIHNQACAKQAILAAIDAGFDNFNIDLMYGLPNQSVTDAMEDLQTALQFKPTHLSWYQLTIEPNTFFSCHPPVLPADDMTWQMQEAGLHLLAENGFQQYEVSAHATSEDTRCRHNINYWRFGDYLGIGAGAHSKMTNLMNGEIIRFAQVKHPRDYLQASKRAALTPKIIAANDVIFEFMLNALRLTDGFSLTLFTERTGLACDHIMVLLEQAKQRGFITIVDTHDTNGNKETWIRTTAHGKKFLNNVMMLFLPS